jgi:hypothetical protein
MRPAALISAICFSGVIFGLAADPCTGATAAWSPRSAGYDGGRVWTRAGLIRISSGRTELTPAAPVKRHALPPTASNQQTTIASHFFSDLRPDRQSPSRDRVQLARTVLARLRTGAMPDRRARTATIAALAGIFYDAHAPPSLS